METAYAQALLKMVTNGMNPAEAVEALKKLLARTGRQMLLPKIGKAFARIAEREQGKYGVTLITARATDQRAAKEEVSAILNGMKVDMKDVVGGIDESLIGGWRLEGREHLVDASFKKNLLSLYNRATQS